MLLIPSLLIRIVLMVFLEKHISITLLFFLTIQLRSSQSYCTDNECFMERKYEFSFLDIKY